MVSRGVDPDYAYLKLRCDPGTTDLITWRLILDRSIARFAGVHGQAIPLDIMWVSDSSTSLYTESIVRCPAESQRLVSAGISGGTSDEYIIRLVASSNYLNMLL